MALSGTIEAERKRYDEARAATRFTNEVAGRVTWFGEAVLKSIGDSLRRIEFVSQKTQFFDRFGGRVKTFGGKRCCCGCFAKGRPGSKAG